MCKGLPFRNWGINYKSIQKKQFYEIRKTEHHRNGPWPVRYFMR